MEAHNSHPDYQESKTLSAKVGLAAADIKRGIKNTKQSTIILMLTSKFKTSGTKAPIRANNPVPDLSRRGDYRPNLDLGFIWGPQIILTQVWDKRWETQRNVASRAGRDDPPAAVSPS